jgi:hypothetical protein
MPVIEKYTNAPELEPRNCQGVDPSDKLSRHAAELILNDVEKHQERFLCKVHAATELAQNQVLFAKALIELYVP